MSTDLIAEVFSCSHCEGTRLPFVRNAVGKFYRFPPIIGAIGQAPLLFVGINPRVSTSNRLLHDAIVNDRLRFEELARNRVGAHAYIGPNGLENHYSVHVMVADRLFPGRPFESIASVTELHFCASTSSAGLPYARSRCAAKYFASVLGTVKPTIVFAVGRHVVRTLKAMYPAASSEPTEVLYSTGRARVVTLPHPNAWEPRNDPIEAAILQAKEQLRRSSNSKESA